jgi:hypothetical protein
MRRGCIAIGEVKCDDCKRPMRYGERYLLVDEEGEKKQRLCLDCCHSHGHVSYGTEKGKQIATFLPKE